MQKLLLYLILLTFPIFIYGQEEIPIPEDIPVLEKLVTVDYEWAHIDVVLNSISQQTGAVFSYGSKVIDPDELVQVHAKKKSTRLVLNSFLDNSIEFKARGKYIILSKKIEKQGTGKEEKILIEGYITDPKTGEKLENATVYDKVNKISATTDEYGYFKLELSPSKTITQLHVAKAGYKDTIITRKQVKSDIVTIDMPENKAFNDSVFRVFTDKLQTNITDGFISVKHWANAVNLNDTLFTKVQISFLPFIGTNQLLGGNTVNDYSFNILAGYVQGVRYLELGGWVNIVRHDASFCQLAGWGNIVGGTSRGFQGGGLFNIANNLYGVQAADIFNLTIGNMSSCQLAGIGNVAAGTANGLQSAGILSIANKMSGAQIDGILSASSKIDGCQISGIISIADSVDGAQISGIINIADDISGCQVSGLVNVANKVEAPQITSIINIADTISGPQISGIVNAAIEVKGAQIASLANVAENVNGAQVSSLLNVANCVNGTQVACFNFSNYYIKGAPVGLISIVSFGVHTIDISANEMQFANFAFKTGVEKFYNIFTVGAKANQTSIWNYGYGVGTIWGKSEKIKKNIECTVLQFQKSEQWSYQNSMIMAYAGLTFKLSRKVSAAVGITYNMLTLDKSDESYETTFSKLAPYTLSNESFDSNTQLQTWVGARIGLRFF